MRSKTANANVKLQVVNKKKDLSESFKTLFNKESARPERSLLQIKISADQPKYLRMADQNMSSYEPKTRSIRKSPDGSISRHDSLLMEGVAVSFEDDDRKVADDSRRKRLRELANQSVVSTRI